MNELKPRLVPLKEVEGPNGIIKLADLDYVTRIFGADGPAIKFPVAIGNEGEAPLHIILGNIEDRDGEKVAAAKQRIYYDNNTFKDIDVGYFEKHIEMGHDHPHWHYNGIGSIELLDLNNNLVTKSKKNSFCVVDEFKYKNLPNSPSTKRFFESGCEDKTEVGISIGWVDHYKKGSSGQYIELNTLQSGEYWLRFQINPTQMVYDIAEPVKIKIFIDKEKNKVYEIKDKNIGT
jgi:hypothetical protein